MSKSDFKFNTTLRVRWMEGDPQGIVYFGAYAGYIEVGLSEYYRNLGWSIYKPSLRSYFDTAVVKATLEYHSPARVDDVLQIFMRVSRIGNTSITMDSELYFQNSDTLVMTAQVVYVGYDPAQHVKKPVPADIRAIVEHFESNGEVLPLEGFPLLHQAASVEEVL